MKPLNIIPSFILILLCLTCVGQSKFLETRYHIDSSNHQHYYGLAKHYLTLDDKDSLFEALMILRRLHYFDSSKYSTSFLKPEFEKIEKVNYLYFVRGIKGRWKFECDCSNLPPWRSYPTTTERAVFKKRMALFYNGDTLVRKTRYCITNKFSMRSVKEFIFQVYFYDDNTAYRIFFRTNGADYNAHLKFSKVNMGMYFSTPDMATDTGERIYMKESASNYRLSVK